MAQRIRAAGVTDLHIETGSRGRYHLIIRDLIGWNPITDCQIEIGDELPNKPWLAVWYHEVIGLGHCRVEHKSSILSLQTHHALSRAVRTVPQLVGVARTIEAAVGRYAVEAGAKGSKDAWLDIPPQGVRYPVNGAAVMVLQKHVTRDVPVVVTILDRSD
jgi:hypothetical protein